MALVHFTRGLALTLLGFASKAYFLLFIAPGMDVGEFAKYFLAVSIALIAGRVLSLGTHEDLVFRVKHSVKRASYYLRGTAIYYMLAWLVVLQALTVGVTSILVAVAISYSLMIAGNGFMTGALRSYSNLFQELNANTPWLLLCLMSTVVEINSADDVLFLLVISHTVIYFANVVAVHVLGIGVGRPSFRVLVGQFRQYRSWLPKSLSSVALAANLRSYPLWLTGLGYVLSDGLAYAFIIGEVIYQLCMVYVHQVHSSLKLQDGLIEKRRLFRAGMVMVSLAVIVPMPVYYVMSTGIVSETIELSLTTLMYTSIYCGTLAFFSLLRVGVWRKERVAGSLRILLLQLLLFVCVGVMVTLMKYNVTLLLIAALINMISMSIYIRRYLHKVPN